VAGTIIPHGDASTTGRWRSLVQRHRSKSEETEEVWCELGWRRDQLGFTLTEHPLIPHRGIRPARARPGCSGHLLSWVGHGLGRRRGLRLMREAGPIISYFFFCYLFSKFYVLELHQILFYYLAYIITVFVNSAKFYF
jgi:hypothetical protein